MPASMRPKGKATQIAENILGSVQKPKKRKKKEY